MSSDFITLLPNSATAQERSLEQSVARATDIPVALRDLWSADAVPAELLPWLAWALSVDWTNPAISEAEKRNLVRSAMRDHQIKGTPRALANALEAVGADAEVVEWFRQEPQGAPYTFRLRTTTPMPEPRDYELLVSAASYAKNVRSHLELIQLDMATSGTVNQTMTPAQAESIVIGLPDAPNIVDQSVGVAEVISPVHAEGIVVGLPDAEGVSASEDFAGGVALAVAEVVTVEQPPELNVHAGPLTVGASVLPMVAETIVVPPPSVETIPDQYTYATLGGAVCMGSYITIKTREY